MLFSDAAVINSTDWRREAFIPGRLLLIGLPLPAAAALFLGKTLLDTWYAHHAARAFDLPWNPVADDLRLALGYPVLIVAAAVRMLRPMEWKGRQI